jgi:hypothetical protein
VDDDLALRTTCRVVVQARGGKLEAVACELNLLAGDGLLSSHVPWKSDPLPVLEGALLAVHLDVDRSAARGLDGDNLDGLEVGAVASPGLDAPAPEVIGDIGAREAETFAENCPSLELI